jgi:hypothetical protein
LIGIESAWLLVVLALTDSFSFGTLLVPVWLLMTPGGIRIHRMLVYLATVAVAYFAIGIGLMTAGRFLLRRASGFLDSEPGLVLQLVVGMVLVILSFALETKAAHACTAQLRRSSRRADRWRERAMDGAGGGPAVARLALTAVVVEVVSMLPYIAATGIIAAKTSMSMAALALLAGYCLVMIAPAMVLTIGRVAARSFVDAPLRRLDGWLARNARSTTLWIVGIAGFFLAATAFDALVVISP